MINLVWSEREQQCPFWRDDSEQEAAGDVALESDSWRDNLCGNIIQMGIVWNILHPHPLIAGKAPTCPAIYPSVL